MRDRFSDDSEQFRSAPRSFASPGGRIRPSDELQEGIMANRAVKIETVGLKGTIVQAELF
jgi:hypothetical protein